jgi:glycosyltransferase involved in cell wall biosynthesis
LIRLAFIVSHPIQYYAPLYRRLAKRDDFQIKVFFTWHAAQTAQFDPGFKKEVAWDIPLLDGYDHEAVPNTSRRPGSDHFWGLQNPSLVNRILDWKPDMVHLTGYAYYSHLFALRNLTHLGLPVLFRGDSHLLDERKSGPRWMLKHLLLSKIYSWPAAFLCVGRANRDYYRAFGVPEAKLFDCPHSIEVARFAEPEAEWESQAQAWREQLQIPPETRVLLFAGKFEDKKRPVPLMRAFLDCNLPKTMLVMVGDGVYGETVRELAAQHPEKFRVLPFQNQSRMPVVYRLGDQVVLPSGYGETWGLAINEAMACGRPALVSDRVGCHADVIRPGKTGEVFRADDWPDFCKKLESSPLKSDHSQREEIKSWATNWSIEQTEKALAQTARYLITPVNKSSKR